MSKVSKASDSISTQLPKSAPGNAAEMPPLKDLAKFQKVTISVSLVDNETIHKLNKKYLNRDTPTDVLSFNINQKIDDETYHLGDIVVSTDRAAAQAPDYNNDLAHEIAELVEHGVLHLLGVHHEGDDNA
ncbi:rRNA maturation RNase YbeY [candidate division WWE3 bacterium]|nr:rRNA maturation RNase YbeY [candidate division WWE3 bacterium]